VTPRWIIPDWPAPARVRAASTERVDGVSQGPYAGFNLGAHVGDEAAHVARNRNVLKAALGLAREPHWLEQVHGAIVLDLDRNRPVTEPADGAVTSLVDEPCVVLTADCLPVLLCGRSGERVGVAHAGWRGLVRGVLPAAVACMGGPAENLLAWLGPAIGPAAYEVDETVRSAFLSGDSGAAGCFEPNGRGRFQADLYGLARRSLHAAGVEAIYGEGSCTFREAQRFFSHRREAPCGRMATVIWLTN